MRPIERQVQTMPVQPFKPSLAGVWNMPPLILHPFAGLPEGPDKLLEGSRAALMLHGLMPSDTWIWMS